MKLRIELDREADGRWIAEAPELPGVLTYSASREQAVLRAQVLALQTVADMLEHGELKPEDLIAFEEVEAA